MKTKIYKLAVLVSLSLLAKDAPAQVYGGNIVGYDNFFFKAGANLFENPFENSPNTLTNLFNQAVPDGTTISLWNPTLAAFGAISTYLNGAWTVDLMLEPGTGAKLDAPSAFTNTFAGVVLNHDGSVLSNPFGLTPPPVFAGSDGTYLMGDRAPVADIGADIFLNIFGRLPNVGEQVATLSGTSTYLGNGDWDNVPVLGVGEAAFFTTHTTLNIQPVPEPGVLSLFSLGSLFICWRICRTKRAVHSVNHFPPSWWPKLPNDRRI